jgi:hypothetical protein
MLFSEFINFNPEKEFCITYVFRISYLKFLGNMKEITLQTCICIATYM